MQDMAPSNKLTLPDGVTLAPEPAIPRDATPEKCPLKPARGHLILVRELPPHMRTALAMPSKSREAGRQMMAEARVLAVGADTWLVCGNPWEAPCAVGDRVLTRGVNAFSTHKQQGSDTIWEVLPFDAVVAVVSEDSVPDIPEARGIGA
jgi:co-chaperonin GroES (HSP10)